MNILITGATGTIGAETVRQALKDPDIKEIILLVRRPPAITDPKITVVLHQDFSSFENLEAEFRRTDALIWCLGVSQTQATGQKYETITCGYTLAAAAYCLRVNPGIRFVFVSGNGADRTEKSRTLFKRVKGKTENGLLASGLKNIAIARPAAVRPRKISKSAPLLYKLLLPLFPLAQLLNPARVIWSDVLARALLRLARGTETPLTMENTELQALGK